MRNSFKDTINSIQNDLHKFKRKLEISRDTPVLPEPERSEVIGSVEVISTANSISTNIVDSNEVFETTEEELKKQTEVDVVETKCGDGGCCGGYSSEATPPVLELDPKEGYPEPIPDSIPVGVIPPPKTPQLISTPVQIQLPPKTKKELSFFQ
jgi:hypothetical protein